MKQLKTFFAGKPVRNILDIGTGAGDFIKILSTVFPEQTLITGIDPSEEALTEARRGNESVYIKFIRMEGEHLSFDDHTFDVVCLSNAMHHLASTDKTLSEMKRVVKAGGWLVIAELVSDGLNEAQENQKMLHHFKSYVQRKAGITHRETWTEAEIVEIIQSTGIKPVLTFSYNRMANSVSDTEKINERINEFAGHLSDLEGAPEYLEKVELFETFKERLKIHGFQMARQIVVVGQVV